MPPIAPYSRPHTIAKLDGRTREARLLREVEAMLVAHVGGKPSATQVLLIRRTARDMLTLELLDAKLTSGTVTDHDVRTHGGISNRVRLALRELGLKAAPVKAPTLAEAMAEAKAKREAAAAA